MKTYLTLPLCILFLTTACQRDASQHAALAFAHNDDFYATESNDGFIEATYDSVIPEPIPVVSREVSYAGADAATKALYTNFYRQHDKKVQTFSVSSQTDTTVQCAEGTVLKIPAGVFVSARTGLAMNGPVEVVVKEYYRTEDILLAPLSTVSKESLLQTGGMIHIEATANGEPCELAPGRSIGVQFATTLLQDDYQLFNGVATADGIVEWEPVSTTFSEAVSFALPARIDEIPVYPGGNKYLTRHINGALKSKLRWRERNMKRDAFVEVNVSEEGLVTEVKVRHGINKRLDTALVHALKSTPRWRGARSNGIRVPYTLTLIAMLNNGEFDVNITRQLPEGFYKQLDANRSAMYANIGGNVNGSNDATAAFFQANRIGWLNCDRFYNNPEPRTDYLVYTGKENAQIRLVLPQLNMVLVGDRRGNGVRFKNVPIGQQGIIVAYEPGNTKTQLAKQKVTIDNNGIFYPDFKSTDNNLLRSELAMLE